MKIPDLRKVHLILTIGGGFVGIAFTLQAFFASSESNPLFYALLITFMALYGYGIYAGLRLADHQNDKKHLLVFYWLQVPWISSPIIAYRFAAGFHVSAGLMGSKLSAHFHVGGDWQFSWFQDAPWGIGVNAVALMMVILLMKEKQSRTPTPTPAAATPPPMPESRWPAQDAPSRSDAHNDLQ